MIKKINAIFFKLKFKLTLKLNKLHYNIKMQKLYEKKFIYLICNEVSKI